MTFSEDIVYLMTVPLWRGIPLWCPTSSNTNYCVCPIRSFREGLLTCFEFCCNRPRMRTRGRSHGNHTSLHGNGYHGNWSCNMENVLCIIDLFCARNVARSRSKNYLIVVLLKSVNDSVREHCALLLNYSSSEAL